MTVRQNKRLYYTNDFDFINTAQLNKTSVVNNNKHLHHHHQRDNMYDRWCYFTHSSKSAHRRIDAPLSMSIARPLPPVATAVHTTNNGSPHLASYQRTAANYASTAATAIINQLKYRSKLNSYHKTNYIPVHGNINTQRHEFPLLNIGTKFTHGVN